MGNRKELRKVFMSKANLEAHGRRKGPKILFKGAHRHPSTLNPNRIARAGLPEAPTAMLNPLKAVASFRSFLSEGRPQKPLDKEQATGVFWGLLLLPPKP